MNFQEPRKPDDVPLQTNISHLLSLTSYVQTATIDMVESWNMAFIFPLGYNGVFIGIEWDIIMTIMEPWSFEWLPINSWEWNFIIPTDELISPWFFRGAGRKTTNQPLSVWCLELSCRKCGMPEGDLRGKGERSWSLETAWGYQGD